MKAKYNLFMTCAVVRALKMKKHTDKYRAPFTNAFVLIHFV